MEEQLRDRKLQVLLAEDNPADVYLIELALKEHQLACEFRIVADGELAAKTLAEVLPHDGFTPDVILIDLNLPRRDGKEVLKSFRNLPRGQSVPIVIITSSDSPADRFDAAELGASCYFRKPFNLDEFMQIGKIVKDLVIRASTDVTAP